MLAYIAYRTSISEQHLFPFSMLAFLAGLLLESLRISSHWKIVFINFIVSYFLSLIVFLSKAKGAPYNFEHQLEIWPYHFLFFFMISTIVSNEEKVTAKLTEGITLLLSVSLIYWTIDYGFWNIDHWFFRAMMVVALLGSVFSVLNALTYLQLSKAMRLLLSVWSSVIMFAFALDNAIRVLSNPNIESTKHFSQGFFIGLQYFLLGVSAVYILQNFMLLVAFLPSKNGNYANELRDTVRTHIGRYSERQVSSRHALLGMLYAVIIYGLNYQYQFLPRHSIIWLVFISFPLILQFENLLNASKPQKHYPPQ